jgi:hypothetical protein
VDTEGAARGADGLPGAETSGAAEGDDAVGIEEATVEAGTTRSTYTTLGGAGCEMTE